MHGRAPDSRVHLPQLDSLRGLACLLVLVAHLKATPLLAWVPDELGVAGVGIFFVLSGFLITRILLSDRAAGRGLLGFYNRRAARIFPIYYLTLGILAFLWPGKELQWAATFSFNFQFLSDARNYFQNGAGSSGAPPVAHFWSLCVEEHFYWVWPLAVMTLPRRLLRCLPVAVIGLTPLVTFYLGRQLTSAGFSQAETDGLLSRLTLTQLPGLSIGALAAQYEAALARSTGFEHRWQRGRFCLRRAGAISGGLLLGGGACLAAALIASHEIARAVHATALHLACGGVFLLVLDFASAARLVLLRQVGRISYGLYLYHLPVYAVWGLLDQGAPVGWLPACGALLTTFLFAAISFYWLELPITEWIRRRPSESPDGRLPWGAALGTALTLLVFGAFSCSVGMGYRSLYVPTIAAAGSGNVWSARSGRRAARTLPREQIETIIVGSSHAEYGFAASEFRELTYNLSHESQDLWYDCQIVEALLPKLPGLKRVIFGVSAFSFRYAISDTDRERWRESLYYYAYGLSARPITSAQRTYSTLALAGSRKDVEALEAKWIFIDEPRRGSRLVARRSQQAPSGQAAALRHQQHGPQRIADHRDKLIRTIRACQAQGVECVLVSFPTQLSYRQHLSPTLLAETRSLMAEIERATGAACYDFSADERFGDGDFYNPDHLNEAGARRFTKLFNEHVDVAAATRPDSLQLR